MKRVLFLILISLPCFAQTKDADLANANKPCFGTIASGPSKGTVMSGTNPTGHFVLYKDTVNNHWAFCAPTNHQFFEIGMQVFDYANSQYAGLNTRVNSKYGTGSTYSRYAPLSTEGIALNFNTISNDSALLPLPISTQGRVDGGNTVKMPFTYFIDSETYALYFGNTIDEYYGISDVFSIFRGGNWLDTFYTGWMGFATSVVNFSNGDITGGYASVNSAALNLLAMFDDSDHMRGLKNYNSPAGTNGNNPGFITGITPYRTAWNGAQGVAYADPINHTKDNLSTWLQGLGDRYTPTSTTASGSAITLAFSIQTPLAVGDSATLANCVNAAYDGPFIVATAPSATTITFTSSQTAGFTNSCIVYANTVYPSGVTCVSNACTATLAGGVNNPFHTAHFIYETGCSIGNMNMAAGGGVAVTGYTSTTILFTLTGASGTGATGCKIAPGMGYTLSALNTAWGCGGTCYSTFGTSETVVASESVGTGTGVSHTFSGTLAHHPDMASLAFFVGGAMVGGDCPWTSNGPGRSNFHCNTGATTNTGFISDVNYNGISNAASSICTYAGGWTCAGTVNYGTGAYSITCTCTNGAALTVNYAYGGYPKARAGGTGLMDEDGSSTWWPADPDLGNINLNQRTKDLDNYFRWIMHQYIGTFRRYHDVYIPNTVFSMVDAQNCYTRPTALSEESYYLDFFYMAGCEAEDSTIATQAISDYNAYGKPIMAYNVAIANPTSPYSANGVAGCLADGWGTLNCLSTQAARGVQQNARINAMWNTVLGGDGYSFYIGADWWQYWDNTSESENFGIKSVLDNVYDGVEDVPGTVTCSPPAGSYSCGGEAGSYGNALGGSTGIAAANLIWFGGSVAPSGGTSHSKGVKRSQGTKTR